MSCNICGQISGDPDNDLLARMLGGEYRRRIPIESPHHAVIPSIGAITVGHTILCPVTHLRRIADVRSRDVADFFKMKATLRQLLLKEFGIEVHLFEHGSDRAGERVPCTVDHAHLHFVPSVTPLRPELPEAYEWLDVSADPRAIARAVGDSEYLYYEAPDGHAMYALPHGVPFASQLMRKSLATAAGVQGAWNWRDNPRLREVTETEMRLAKRTARSGPTP